MEETMPTYDFECEPCAYYTEIFQDIHAPDTHQCPICEQETLKKVFINSPMVSIRGEPKTIGHLADRNTQKMGKYEKQDRDREANVELHQKNKQVSAQRNRINKMTQQQRIKWIKDGD